MSMYSPKQSGARAAAHSPLGVAAAWISLFLPIVAGLVYLFVRPAWFLAPETVYWASFACGVAGFAFGCVGVATIGRRVDWYVLTPAIVGIVLSLALCYFALTFGILASGGPVPSWNQIFPWWQGPPPHGRVAEDFAPRCSGIRQNSHGFTAKTRTLAA